ncbi:MAG: hypothetical protein ABJE95_10020 [Byssovorax sp.]
MTSEPRRLLDTAFVTLGSPTSVGFSFLALEITVVICGVLALLHALRARRGGDGAPLFVWAVSFTYGIVMELSSYNFIDSFSHGQFTVMFYHHQLPLYVVTLYPVLQYTSIITARRLRLGLVPQMFLSGLLIVAMDMPFDILGPTQGWWLWSASDPNMAFRWHDVPVTSYYWHLAWGGILAGVTRVFGRYGGDVQKPWRLAALALPLSLLTIFLGLLSFLPFHLLKYLGVPDGTIVAGLFGAALAVTFFSRNAAPAPPARDPRLLVIPVLYYACLLLVAVVAQSRAGAAFGGKMAVIAGVTLLALLAHSRAHRGETPTPAPAVASLR